MCGRRFGKSELSQIEIITSALKGEQVAYITPTYNLAKTFFDKLVKVVPFQTNRSDLHIKFPTGGEISFFTGERLDNLRGRKFHLAVIDEASFIANLEDGWLNSIRPTLTDYIGRALFLSTPKGRNFFYSLYMNDGKTDWQSFKFTTYDNPHINKDEIDSAREQLPHMVFEQEYMANPAENAANPFGSAYIRQCIFPMQETTAAVYGIDLAKSTDWTVIIGMDRAGGVCYFERFQADWRTTKQKIIALGKTPMLIDSTGVGDPITEELQHEGMDATGFKFSQTSKQQLMEGLQAAIHQRKITYPEGIIVDELELFEYQFTRTGVKYSAPNGFHDDAVMALALANHHVQMYRNKGKYSFA